MLQQRLATGLLAAPAFWRSQALIGSCIGAQAACRYSSASSSTLTDEDRRALNSGLLVNTLELTRSFEHAGLPRDAAEHLAERITALILTNKMKMDDCFVSKKDMDKTILEQQARVTNFKTELQKAQDMLTSNLNKDIDRQLAFMEKTRAEFKHELDKLTAAQRLDLNLEKGRMRDELEVIRGHTTALEIKCDREINVLKSSVEQAKNDTIKSVITILGTFSAIAFTISRFVQMSAG